MEIANSMKGITENIIGSYNVRVKALGDLVADTHETLKGFASVRKKMAREQAESLAHFTRGLSKSVEDMLKGFREDHQQMSEEQTKHLTDFITNLTNDVNSMVSGFQKDRGKMSKEIKSRLAKEVKDIETYVKNKLKEFSDAHADMSKELKRDLDKYVAGIVSETRKLLGGFEDERKKMAANWQSMAATLAKKRGIKPKVEAEVKVRPVKETIKVLEFINKHPEGVKVGDMEEPLGVARTRLGVIAKKLFEEDKVRKEGSIYFSL